VAGQPERESSVVGGRGERFDQARTLCRDAGVQRITFRGDTDFFADAAPGSVGRRGVRFIFGYDASVGLIRRAETVPEAA